MSVGARLHDLSSSVDVTTPIPLAFTAQSPWHDSAKKKTDHLLIEPGALRQTGLGLFAIFRWNCISSCLIWFLLWDSTFSFIDQIDVDELFPLQSEFWVFELPTLPMIQNAYTYSVSVYATTITNLGSVFQSHLVPAKDRLSSEFFHGLFITACC